jgi:hypothetical protein
MGAGSLEASSGQGFCVVCQCGEGKTLGKEGASRAHRGSRSLMRQFWWRRCNGVLTMAVAPRIGNGWLRLLQHQGRKARVRSTEIEAGVAGKPSSPQDGNGGGSKSRGGGGSGDRRTVWANMEKALEGGGALVRGVPCEREESEA